MENKAGIEAVNESLHLLESLESLSIGDGESSVPGQQIKIREDQVKNNAGGFVFKVDDLTRVRRFLILGTDGGTYYVTEKALTIQNLASLIEIINSGKGGMILREIVDISLAGRAPKQNATLFALALCARYNVKDRKNLLAHPEEEQSEADKNFNKYLQKLQIIALKMVNKVCRIPTHLFMFVKYCEIIAKSTSDDHTGWGRAMRKCIAEWYLQKSPKELAMHITKYANREGWTHRDLLRLAHPMSSMNNGERANQNTLIFDQLFHYACKGDFDETKGVPTTAAVEEAESGPVLKRARCDYVLTDQMIENAKNSEALEFIRAVKQASALANDEAGEKRCVELIKEYGLVREHIPTQLLNSSKVWVALLEHMPMTALLRNLSKLATLGLLDDATDENRKHVDMVVSKILNQDAIYRARIHPISVLLAAAVYKHGKGVKGKLSWETNARVQKALDECFLLAFKNVVPTNKRYCLALDVSGSMTCPINGGVLSCRDASAAMANIFLRTEKNVECVAFQDELTPLPFTHEMTVNEMVEYVDKLPFGGTDCALPMVWAKNERKQFDVFVVFTDCETWAGKVHPFEALKTYREQLAIPDAKLVVMGMAANEFTIADQADPFMLDIVGLDSSVPELLHHFVLNQI